MFLNSYAGRRVLVTGDTGFKGSWLSWWLSMLGAKVSGFALPPQYRRGPFASGRLDKVIRHRTGDIRTLGALDAAFRAAKPEVIFHLAAQAIVRESYEQPVGTFETNVVGTANVLEAVRRAGRPCAVIVVTSDKCYENREWSRSYRETDPMGGHDPYSASKGCAELVVSAYRRSFFGDEVVLASARAGNVIGPGDWSRDRIVPDAITALLKGEPIRVRNPRAIRPWQHVLEPLSGYLWLGAKLLSADAARFAEAWNFGPVPSSTRTVKDLADRVVAQWGSGAWIAAKQKKAPHEARLLSLNIDKAARGLAWRPVWNFDQTVERTVDGYRAMMATAGKPQRVRACMSAEIETYAKDARARRLAWAKE